MAKTKPEGQESASDESTVPNRVVMVNPLSKGNLGKTTFYEYLVTCLEESNIGWAGANMDNRHLAFQQSHNTHVKDLFNDGVQAVDEYHPVFTAARRSSASVYLIDQRAQADLAFLQSARDTGFLKSCRDHRVRIVPICVALDDLDYIQNLDNTVAGFADEGIIRWVVLTHSGLHGNDMFLRTGLYDTLMESGAARIDLPWLSVTTMSRYTGLNASEGGPFSFRAAMQQPLFRKEDMCVFELQTKIANMAKQFRKYGDLLLPDGVNFTPVEDMGAAGWHVGTSAENTANTESSARRRKGLSAAFMGDEG